MGIGIGGGGYYFYNQPTGGQKTKAQKEEEALKKLNDAGKNVPLKEPPKSDGPQIWINRL